MEYNFNEIEQKWQQYWQEKNIYKVDVDKNRPKFYVLDMFPYPSGAGLHVGHPLGYIASDIYSRYKRMQGFNVLHPMGYDAFGLPAEQYAIQTGQHPAVTTDTNIKRYREQLDKIGFSYDWSREVRTCDPNYYKWTQWTFIQLFKHWYNLKTNKAESIETLIKKFEQNGNALIHAACSETKQFSAAEWKAMNEKERQEILLNYRLVYLAETLVNWCPQLGTVLANDEVVNGLSVRGGYPVEQKEMKQWLLRITAYSQRLLEGLDNVEWTDSLKEMQRNWIGRSEGAEIKFNLSPTLSRGEGENADENDVPGYFHSDAATWNLLLDKAKEMRCNPSLAESIIWQHLRNSKAGYRIRRQHIIDKYIADFVCLEKSTIIEIDGHIHDLTKEEDALRTQRLNELGFKVIRYKNEEVIAQPEVVVNKIKDVLQQQPSVYDKDQGSSLSSGEGWGEVEIFTTRADTIFGVTFMVLAPESKLVQQLTTPEQLPIVETYLDETRKRTQRERMADVKKVSGVFTGAYAINPLTNEEIPIWISDYVLMGYGTGAIMAVPGHDSRDFAFARHFNLPIKQVVVPEGETESDPATWSESKDSKAGLMVNSGFITGLKVHEAIQKTKKYIEQKGIGKIKVNFRLRDAIFSRQRYWGEPFPVYYKNEIPYVFDEKDLPLELPLIDAFLPTEKGEPPLGRAKDWKTKEGYPIELSTMPGFAGSSGYYLRYMDPQNNNEYFSKEANQYWENVDLYIGGTEHATGHLIYSRFWNKFLFDIGIACKDEPFKKLINQGMIQGRSNFVYRINGTNKFVSHTLKDQYDVAEIHVDVNMVSNDILDTTAFCNWHPEYKNAEFIFDEDGKYRCGWAVEKMSKSMFNVVNPDIIIEKYGADTLRLYEMFLGPLEMSKPWDTNGIDGVHRFLRKLWRLFFDKEGQLKISEEEATADELKSLHKTIKKVDEDIKRFSFNTAVSQFMICVNELSELKCNKRKILEPLVLAIAPFAPHVAEELWQQLGHDESIVNATFPKFNEVYLVENTFSYPVSVNGKTRMNIELPLSLENDEIEKIVLADDKIQKWMDGKTPKKIIIVKKRIINIVV